MKTVLLDIEGTITSFSFVHKTLFPFAKKNMEEFLSQNIASISNEINELHDEYIVDFTNQIYGRRFDKNSAESIAEYLLFLIDVDRKSKPLKTIQGMIWQKGYESGELHSEMFEEIPQAFEKWYQAGTAIAIYSSGSVLAQKLLFKYSNFGDLSKYVSAWFDTNVGGKKESKSYRKIAENLQNRKHEILFVSDNLEELDAAHKAGLDVTLSVREGNAEITNAHHYHIAKSLLEI